MSGMIWATFGRFSSEFVRARAEPPAKLARRRPGKQFACGFCNHRMFQGMPLVRSLRLRDIVCWGNRGKYVSKGWLVDSPKCIFSLNYSCFINLVLPTTYLGFEWYSEGKFKDVTFGGQRSAHICPCNCYLRKCSQSTSSSSSPSPWQWPSSPWPL